MKTQKIVLALALAVVTPAVVSAQSYGAEKMLYVTNNTLNKIRLQAKEKQQKQEQPQTPVQKQEEVNTNNNNNTSTYYIYTGREGHMMALGNARREAISRKAKQQEKSEQPANNDSIPTFVHDSDTISNNSQVTLDSTAQNKREGKRYSQFVKFAREIGSELGQALARQAPYDK